MKQANPQVTGTMTDQTLRYEWALCEPNGSITSIDEHERISNSAPLGIFDMKTSAEVFTERLKQKGPTSHQSSVERE